MPLGPVWPVGPVSSGDSSFPVPFDLVLLRSWRDIFIWLLGLTLLEITRNRKSRPLLRAGWGEQWAWQGTEGEREVCARHGVAGRRCDQGRSWWPSAASGQEQQRESGIQLTPWGRPAERGHLSGVCRDSTHMESQILGPGAFLGISSLGPSRGQDLGSWRR